MSLRDAAQQALKMLKRGVSFKPGWVPDCEDAIAALEAALAEPQPQPEPVTDEVKAQALDALNRMQSIWMMSDGRHPRDVLRSFVQLASTPTRQPLTDEEIIRIGIEARAVEGTNILPITFARALERAHNIGGDK